MKPSSMILKATVVLIIQVITLTVAQAASSVTSSSAVATHTITVGEGDHKFRPEVTQAESGDIIEFQFFPPNHSVVRAEYEYPCIPYELTGRGKIGFFSGFHPVDAILSNPPSWSIKINDTNPIFFYCSAPGSCISFQMVGVINPNASTSLEVQKELAKDSAYMLQPGDSFPAESSTVPLSSSVSSTSSTTPTSTSITPATTTIIAVSSPATTSAVPSPTSHGLSTGVIVGIAVGCVAILGLAAALFFFIGRSRTLKQEVNRSSFMSPPSSSMLQHQGYLPKSTNMTDASSRNSLAASPRIVPSDRYNGMSIGVMDPKSDYIVNIDEVNQPSQHVDRSNPTTNANSSTPHRQPSVLLNPNNPQEMYSDYNRY